MERTAALKEQGIIPTLAIVRCGANPSDLSYEKGATKRAELVGVAVKKYELPEDVTKEALMATIDEINGDDSVHGVLMFRPLPCPGEGRGAAAQCKKAGVCARPRRIRTSL